MAPDERDPGRSGESSGEGSGAPAGVRISERTEGSAFTPDENRPAPAPLPALRGRVLDGRYEIVHPVGRGGMATVFLARDVRHGRDVAVKVLAPELGGSGAADRFHREIRIAAALRHPHVVPVFDSGEVDGLVYFVMPHVVGESLRARLRRDPQLPVAEALAIARDVADALDFAHARGIVHRDVKPENVLLEGGRALVADFGVARALGGARDAAGGATLTGRGVIVGTPAYMSPEQATSDEAVDARADVYALGCVVYEMLAGEPPFSGGGARAIMAKHVHATPVSLGVLRPAAAPLAVAVATALAKARADRYASAGAFVRALEAAAAVSVARSRRRRVLTVRGLSGVALVVSALAAVAAADRAGLVDLRRGGVAAAALDTAAVAVFPFDSPDLPGGGASATLLVQDALRRWRGVAVVDPAEAEPLPDGGARLSARAARTLAARRRAGRFVRGAVTWVGDSLRVRATLHDTRADSVLGDVTVRLPADGADAAGGAVGGAVGGAARAAAREAAREAAVANLVARLLFPHVDSATRALVGRRTPVPRAYSAFAEGMAAVREWELARADSAFAVAADADGEFALASLWLAQVRSWQRAVPARWRVAAEKAGRGKAQLDAREGAFADALLALNDGRRERACPIWERLTSDGPTDFAAWYGYGTCLLTDSAVVRDRGTPTGWRFRTSYHQMLRAHQTAFRLMPSIHGALAHRSFADVRRLFVTSRNMVREGWALPPDTLGFFARPAWAGDSLVFVPFPKRRVNELDPATMLSATDEAVRHQRELFRDVAVGWLAAYPSSALAMEALALSLEMLGAPAALDSLRRARRLAVHDRERRRLAANEAWLSVKFALPDDLASLRSAARLADSLLTSGATSAADAELLASLAVLTGRAARAAALVRHAHSGQPERTPSAIAQPAWALLAFAALGGPVDSIVALERHVRAAIDRSVEPLRQRAERLQWLARAGTLAFPTVALTSVSELAGQGDPLLDAQAAVLRGDDASALRGLAELRSSRRGLRPADVTLDAVYPEAALLARIGDARAAIAWLDPALRALDATQPHSFSDVVRGAALVRAMALRAELADRTGDRAAARRWAGAVSTLWTYADPFLAPVLARMQQLAR